MKLRMNIMPVNNANIRTEVVMQGCFVMRQICHQNLYWCGGDIVHRMVAKL
jgi:hypothetical protein